MTATVRIAGAGAGYYAQFHVDAWTAMQAVDYAAVCDTDADKARALADRFGVRQAYCEIDEMLDEVHPHVLDIVTPAPSHLVLAEAAFSRGIDVICQKPLAPQFGDAVRLVELAQRYHRRLFVHENFRYRPWFQETRKLLDSGLLGTVHSLAFRLRPGDGQGTDAYLDRQPYFREMDRFLVHETAIHFIDTFRYLLGEVVAVTARLRQLNPVIAGEDAGYIIFEFRDGPTGLFDGNRLNGNAAADPRLTLGEMWLEGSAGVLRMDGAARLWWTPHGGTEVEHHYDRCESQFAGGAVRALQESVIASLLHGAPDRNSGRDYLTNLRVEDAIYRSHHERRVIELAAEENIAPAGTLRQP